jgi:hypothetical protein
MADQSICLSPPCGFVAEGAVATCPRCGKSMYSPANIRRRGCALIFIGAFIALLMGAIALFAAPYLLDAANNGGAAGERSIAAEAKMALTVFALVILLGFLFVVNGLIMMASGRPNRLFVRLSLALIGLVFVLGLIFY